MKITQLTAALLTAALALETALPVCAADTTPAYTYGDLTYVYLEDGTVAIQDCPLEVTSVTVPSEIEGKPVTAILSGAFDWSQAETVTLPDTVTYIGSSAFYNCQNLTSIDLGDGLQYVDVAAFESCKALTSVTLPDSITVLAHSAFSSCPALETVTIGDGIEVIEEFAFEKCTSLRDIQIGSGLERLGASVFSGCTALERVVLPEGLRHLSKSLFYNCTGLTSVTLPSTLLTVEKGAFQGCSSLAAIALPDGLTEIGAIAFSGDTLLTDCTIPESVIRVGRDAFAKTPFTAEPENGLVVKDDWAIAFNGRTQGAYDLVIPDGVRGIAQYALAASNAATLTMPDSVLFLGAEQNLMNVKSVRMSERLVLIDDGAFASSIELAEPHIPASVVYVGRFPFSKNSEWYQSLPDGPVYLDGWCLGYKGYVDRQMPENTSLSIADGTVGIAAEAFMQQSVGYDQENLVGVTLPDSLLYIGDDAFRYCINLDTIDLPESLVMLGNGAFVNTGLTELTIPATLQSIGTAACGFYDRDHGLDSFVPVEGFTVKGYEGTLAEEYADVLGLTFEPLGEVDPGILGDVDGSGTVDVLDVVLLQKHLLGMQPLTLMQAVRANVYDDETIDIFDLGALKRMLVG